MTAYAGIGSRKTPLGIQELMEYAADALRGRGYTLRSGHAPGADQAFEGGAYSDAEVYLPWPNFEPDVPIDAGFILDRPADAAYRLAAQFHPAWGRLSNGARALHARNCHQVLGYGLKDPAKFVICWTPGGTIDGTGQGEGGTAQALRIAHAHGIPVFNLARPEHLERVEDFALAGAGKWAHSPAEQLELGG